MKFIRDVGLLYQRKMIYSLRNPVWVFMSVASPLLYLILYAPLLGKLGGPGFNGANAMNIFIPGLLIMLAIFGTLFVGFGLIGELREGLVERLRVTPASRLALLLGPVLRDVTVLLIQTIIVTLISIPMGLIIHWNGFLLLLVIIVLIGLLMSSFSYALALILKSEDAMAPFMQGINLPLLLLSGILLPMTLAPVWLQTLAHFNPLYYAVDASRYLIAGNFSAPAVWQAFALLIPITGIVLVWAARSFQKAIY